MVLDRRQFYCLYISTGCFCHPDSLTGESQSKSISNPDNLPFLCKISSILSTQTHIHLCHFTAAASSLRVKQNKIRNIFTCRAASSMQTPKRCIFFLLCNSSFRTDRVRPAALDLRFLMPGKPRRHESAFLPPPALLSVCRAQRHSACLGRD